MNGRENYYIIKRAALWLAPEAISSLIKNDYIELVTSIEVEQDCKVDFKTCDECKEPEMCNLLGCKTMKV